MYSMLSIKQVIYQMSTAVVVTAAAAATKLSAPVQKVIAYLSDKYHFDYDAEIAFLSEHGVPAVSKSNGKASKASKGRGKKCDTPAAASAGESEFKFLSSEEVSDVSSTAEAEVTAGAAPKKRKPAAKKNVNATVTETVTDATGDVVAESVAVDAAPKKRKTAAKKNVNAAAEPATEPATEPAAEPATEPAAAPEETKKRGRKAKKDEEKADAVVSELVKSAKSSVAKKSKKDDVAAADEPVKEAKEAKEKKASKKKAAGAAVEQPVEQPADETVEVEVEINVEPFEYEGVTYYIDPNTNQIYNADSECVGFHDAKTSQTTINA